MTEDWRDDRIGSALRGKNPTVLAELAGGFAVIGDTQFLPGYCVLLAKDPSAKALAQLPRGQRLQFLADVDLLATAVERACRSEVVGFQRINIDILGNQDEFVHAHVWPRYTWEPAHLVQKPVWLHDPDNWRDAAHALNEQRHGRLRQRITEELRTIEG